MRFRIQASLFDNFCIDKLVECDEPAKLTEEISKIVQDFWDDMPKEYGGGYNLEIKIKREY